MAPPLDSEDRIRQPLVYLGGMGRVRAFTRLGTLFCLTSCAVFFCRQLLHEPIKLMPFIALYLAGFVVAVGARLWALRQVVSRRGGWFLAPLIGPARPIPTAQHLFVRGDDVVAVTLNGRRLVFGVDRLPSRDPAAVRRSLLRNLPRS